MFCPSKVLRDHNFTQKQVAELMGVTPMSVHTFVKGNPTVETVEKMAKVIGADVLEFFTPLHKDDPLLENIINRF